VIDHTSAFSAIGAYPGQGAISSSNMGLRGANLADTGSLNTVIIFTNSGSEPAVITFFGGKGIKDVGVW
jgi:hypothetical protein